MSLDRYRVRASRCPFCSTVLDAATPTDDGDATPRPGDTSLCLCCAQVLFFGDDLSLRKPATGELEGMFKADPTFARDVRRAQRAIRNFDRSG